MNLDEISKQFREGKFSEIIEKYLAPAKSMTFTDSPSGHRRNARILYFLLASCMQCGYYCDYLDVLKEYEKYDPLEKTSLSNHSVIIILTFALESLVYCLYNNKSEKLEIDYNIPEKIEFVTALLESTVQKSGEPYTQRQCELKALCEDYKNGRMPIYSVEFLYPFEPIIKDYIFDLAPCYPYISMEVKKIARETDNYTSFKFLAYGLSKPDSFWRGPKWETNERFPAVRKTLDIVNMMLLQAVKASPGKMVQLYNIEQVSTVSLFQYRWDKKQSILGGTLTGTDFTAQMVGGNARWHEFTDEELLEINRGIIETYNTKPFVTTFHHATNLLSAGFNTEAFILFCACCEGMTYHWCEEIANIYGIHDSYIAFSREKTSKCDSCGYYTGKPSEKPCGDMEPTLFANLAYLRENGCITKKEQHKLRSLLSKIRNDDLRNKTTHGSNYRVSKQEADQSYNALLSLQEFFVEITARLTTNPR